MVIRSAPKGWLKVVGTVCNHVQEEVCNRLGDTQGKVRTTGWKEQEQRLRLAFGKKQIEAEGDEV